MKISFTMTVCDAVRLHDELDITARHFDSTLLGFVQAMVKQAIDQAERDLERVARAPNEEECKMYREGQRIQAIGALRARVGGGLKEAKDAMERAVPPREHGSGVWADPH